MLVLSVFDVCDRNFYNVIHIVYINFLNVFYLYIISLYKEFMSKLQTYVYTQKV